MKRLNSNKKKQKRQWNTPNKATTKDSNNRIIKIFRIVTTNSSNKTLNYRTKLIQHKTI